VWLSINSTLVWGLSKVSRERAWKELLANTLFHHARTYPRIWFGIWSGPDTYLNAKSDRPGETYIVPHESGVQTWPVQILFAHSETLNSSLWMMGIEATAEGIAVSPRLPFDRWSWSGAGFSLSYDKTFIHGSISGAAPELLAVELQLPADWHGAPIEIEEGDVKRKLEHAGSSVRLNVWVAPHSATQFSVTRL
jgi:hypothetical protein